MANFAIVEGTTVVNCIIAENIETAQQVVGVGKTCVEYVIPETGDLYSNENFIKPVRPQVDLQVAWAMDLGN
jgi:hypothetical protein